jgi:hypothetical protein
MKTEGRHFHRGSRIADTLMRKDLAHLVELSQLRERNRERGSWPGRECQSTKQRGAQ